MSLYNDIEGILESRLIMSLKNNSLNKYLFGLEYMFLKEDLRDPNSDHNFMRTMLVYNNFHKKYPDLKLDRRFVLEILKQLNDDDYFEVYSVYEALFAQIKLEEKKWATFNIDKKELLIILKKIESVLNNHKKNLEIYYYKKGSHYKNGVYEYINSTKEELYDRGSKAL